MRNRGYIYLIKNEYMPNLYKIGQTNNMKRRLAELNSPTSIPAPFEIECVYEVRNYKIAEKALHEVFDRYRVSPNREFFLVDPEQVKYILDKEGRDITYKIISEG
ncbi:MAG: GIY-YIG nuclease family protein [Alphaproteobacteria bacterium]|jgi:hypothetical protein|nr:GIY-YIG nuclease family protein [Alphaproteobacteria bacterium]